MLGISAGSPTSKAPYPGIDVTTRDGACGEAATRYSVESVTSDPKAKFCLEAAIGEISIDGLCGRSAELSFLFLTFLGVRVVAVERRTVCLVRG